MISVQGRIWIFPHKDIQKEVLWNSFDNFNKRGVRIYDQANYIINLLSINFI